MGEVTFGKYKDEEDELDEKGQRKYKNEEDAIVWVAFETITPLLDCRISAAERMLCHFRLGVTLFHEFVVSPRTPLTPPPGTDMTASMFSSTKYSK